MSLPRNVAPPHITRGKPRAAHRTTQCVWREESCSGATDAGKRRNGELPDLVRGHEQITLDNIERMGGWAAELAAQIEATRLPTEPVA